MMSSNQVMKSYLQEKKLNKIEQNKANKDGLLIGKEIEYFAKIGWEEMDKTDLELRLKWYGMFWRPKTPGKFMLMLRVPNGVINAHQLKIVSSIVARYGDSGSCDVTTRQSLQLRGILISDLPEILRRLNKAGIYSIQSGFDNPRNITGNPIAGIDPEEIIDTRDYVKQLNDYLTNNGKGNEDFSNLPRKWNTAIAGSKDNFLLHNDLVFLPVKVNNILGFSVWVGGILSSVLNDYAIPLNVWIEDNKICEFTNAVLSLWRDHGERSARPKGRFRLYLNKIGIENFRDLVEERFGKLKTDPGSDFCKIPRSFLGVNQQKQKDMFFAGLHIPVGRLSSEDLQDIALLSENYGSGDIRLTEDQNIIITNIPKDKLEEFKKENLLDKFPLNPGHLSAGTVSCTGNTYCNFALTNTKDTALEVSQLLDQELDLDDEIKIHWTGCPNSCGQAYMGAIGLTGKKGRDSEGKIVDAYDICIGGEQGPSNKIGKIHLKKVPKYEIKNTLKQILIENFSAKEKVD